MTSGANGLPMLRFDKVPAPVQGWPLQVAGIVGAAGAPRERTEFRVRRYDAGRTRRRRWSVVPPTPNRRCHTDPQSCSAPAACDSRRSSPWRRRIPSIWCRHRHRRSSRSPGRRGTRPTCRRRIEARDQAVAAGLLRFWAAKLLQPDQSNSMNVRDSPQAVGVRVSMLILVCSGLNVKTPLPREWLAAARPGQARDELLADRQRLQVPVLARVGRGVAGIAAVGALQKIEPGEIDKAADADRGVGARDQKRPREAAAADRLPWYRLGAERPAGTAAGMLSLPAADPALAGRCGAATAPDWPADRPVRRLWRREDLSAMRSSPSGRRSPQRSRYYAFWSSLAAPPVTNL